jgi:DNA-binding response OmpR family regulator
MTTVPPVLVIDDDLDSRTLLEMALSAAGFTVASARNGAEALVIARRDHPSVILLDLMMPIMDGYAFRAAQLREPELATIPVICVSGRHDAEAAAKQLKTVACISKPFALDKIVESVGSVIGRQPPSGII